MQVVDGIVVSDTEYQDWLKGRQSSVSIRNGTFRVPNADVTKNSLATAKLEWAQFRGEAGFKPVATPLLTPPSANSKLGKSKQLIYGLSLAPSRYSGINVCQWSTPECVAGCVAWSGNGIYPMVKRARIAKTQFLFAYPQLAAILLKEEIGKACFKAEQKAVQLGIRLNTFSDLNWTTAAPWLFETWPFVSFYDYSKSWLRVSRFHNYHLTYSASEHTTTAQIIQAVNNGRNVAVVFAVKPKVPLPGTWEGLTVIDADKTDWRPGDPVGVVCGLRAKGRLRKNPGRFVRSI